jgi:hypothetical protein
VASLAAVYLGCGRQGAAPDAGGAPGRDAVGSVEAEAESGGTPPDGSPTADAGLAGPLTGSAAEDYLACGGQTIWSRAAADGGFDAAGDGEGGTAADGAAPDGGAAPPGWGLAIGGAGYDQGTAVAANARGDVVVGSVDQGDVDFGEGAISASCSMLSSYSPDGRHRWSRSIAAWIARLAVSDAGEILALLTTGALADFAPDGVARWVLPAPSTLGSIAFAADGGVLTTTYESVIVNGATQTSGLLQKLAPDGEPLWTRSLGVGPSAMAVSGTGDIFVYFQFLGTATVLGRTFQSAGQDDLLILKLDGEGNMKWSRAFGSPLDDQTGWVVATSDGGVVFSAVVGALDFGGGPIISTTDRAAVIAKLDGQGTYVAARTSTVSGFYFPLAGATRSGGVLGYYNFAGSLDVEGTTVHTGAPGDTDFLVVEYASTLELQQLWHFGNGGGTQQIVGLAVDGSGAMLLTGSFQGHLDLGSGVIRTAGSFDAFLGKVTP